MNCKAWKRPFPVIMALHRWHAFKSIRGFPLNLENHNKKAEIGEKGEFAVRYCRKDQFLIVNFKKLKDT